MRLTPIVAILAIASGAYYGKILHDQEVKTGKVKTVEEDKPPKDNPPPPPPPPPVSDTTKKPRKTPEKTPVLSASDEEKLADARGLLEKGKFDAAQEATDAR